MILLLNGAFGIGKTTVARALVSRLPRAVLFDPEPIGVVLQRLAPGRVDDFQDLRVWRRLTVAAIRITRLVRPNVVVPMAFSNLNYLGEIRRGLSRFEPRVVHVCLAAPLETVHERLRGRGESADWVYRRAAECCAAHQSDAFAIHVDAATRPPEEIAAEIVRAIR